MEARQQHILIVSLQSYGRLTLQQYLALVVVDDEEDDEEEQVAFVCCTLCKQIAFVCCTLFNPFCRQVS